MSVVSFSGENIFTPLSKCLRPEFLCTSYLQSGSRYCSKKIYPHVCCCPVRVLSLNNSRRMRSLVISMVDGSKSDSSGSRKNNGTRLVRAIRSFQTKLKIRIKELRKGLSVKILFFLVGFYCATAFATVIGQTGDWDILSAGLAVVMVEAIGALMYRASLPFLDRIRNFIIVFNYWKAGLSLGLFLDAFKYEIDSVLESCNPFNTEINIFPDFW
ncbi:uncharacterized protein [Typha latifolia]|uniref:uncharacterized protein isoform X1 n=1 Tax=Typha latifolia TaxID=4733 RepID=UPI003C2C11A1